MVKGLFCQYNLFDALQGIYLLNDNELSETPIIYCTIDNLPSSIYNLCQERSLYDVFLAGDINTNNIIIEAIQQLENTEFNQQKINFHIAKENNE